MIVTTAIVQTDHASKYILQLCKHFTHRVEVAYDEKRGECRFVCGTASLHADPGQLRIEVMAPDEEQAGETQDVVEKHLLRFAFREELQPLKWHPVQKADANVAVRN